MSSPPPKGSVLIVDDESSIRNSLAMVLEAEGYETSIAKDGFDALLQLKRTLPDIVLSDLNMPRMSGFEFLSVLRRRFPEISVIAMSGAYTAGTLPSGVLADGFYAKGQSRPEALLLTVEALIRTSAAQANAHHEQVAPVWIPRNGKDSSGIPYIVVTCTECLRSFPLNVVEEANPEVMKTPCFFCGTAVRYIIDFSLFVVSPPKRPAVTHARLEQPGDEDSAPEWSKKAEA